MDEPTSFQEQLDVLAHGEVQPLLFATDVVRQGDTRIDIVLIDPSDGVDARGHTSTRPIYSRQFASQAGPATDAQIREWRRETLVEFAARLSELMSDDTSAS